MTKGAQATKVIGYGVAILVVGLVVLWTNRDRLGSPLNTNTSNATEDQTASTPSSDPNFKCYPRYVETVEITADEISVDVSEVQWYTINQDRQIVDHFSRTASVIVGETYMTAMLGNEQVEHITLLTWTNESAIFRVKHMSPGENWECDFTAIDSWDITDQE